MEHTHTSPKGFEARVSIASTSQETAPSSHPDDDLMKSRWFTRAIFRLKLTMRQSPLTGLENSITRRIRVEFDWVGQGIAKPQLNRSLGVEQARLGLKLLKAPPTFERVVKPLNLTNSPTGEGEGDFYIKQTLSIAITCSKATL